MTTEDIIKQITPIFRDIMDNDRIVISYETSAKDIEEWDSISHIQMVVAIEKHFKIRFKSSEINSYNNVGGMCDAIRLKISD